MQKSSPLARPALSLLAVPPLNLTGALLVAGLLSALVGIFSGLLVRFVPAWRPAYLIVACFVVAIEAALVRYRMLQRRHFEIGALRYLAAELFALAVGMRAVALLSLGPANLMATAQAWVRSPFAALDAVFLGCFFLGLLVAVITRAAMHELGMLDLRSPGPRAEFQIDADFYRAELDARERVAVSRIAAWTGWGGAAALAALAAQAVDVTRLTGPALALPPAVALAGCLYLVCAVLLYSRARLGLLSARWHRDEVAVEPAIAGRWRWFSTALVAVVAILGLLLPSSYGDGVVQLARTAFLALLSIASLTALLLGAVAMGALGIALLVPALLLALIAGGPQVGQPLPPPPLVPPVSRPGERIPTEPPLAPGVIFWICMAILAAYAIWTVLRRQEWARVVVARLRGGGLAPLLAWLSRAWVGARGYASKVGEAIAERLRRPPAEPATPRRPRPRLGRMAPGERVRYFYTSTLRRAARVGLARRAADTPGEYGVRLRSQLPMAADDIERLTDAYLAAVYAPRPTSPEEAAAARGPWSRLRRSLRGLGRT